MRKVKTEYKLRLYRLDVILFSETYLTQESLMRGEGEKNVLENESDTGKSACL